MAVGVTGMDSFALECPATEAGHVGLGARFIQEDQPGRVKARLPLPPEPPRPGDVRAVLLAGAERLFLYVNSILPNTTWIACTEHFNPVASRSFHCKVRSFFLASNERIWLQVGRDNHRLASAEPVSRGDVASVPTLLQKVS